MLIIRISLFVEDRDKEYQGQEQKETVELCALETQHWSGICIFTENSKQWVYLQVRPLEAIHLKKYITCILGCVCVCVCVLNCVQFVFDPMDCSPLGSSVHGISQSRILKWVAISYSSIYTIWWLKISTKKISWDWITYIC